MGAEKKNLIFAIFWIMAPSFESSNYNQELLIMIFVSSFCKKYLFEKQGYWMLLGNFI